MNTLLNLKTIIKVVSLKDLSYKKNAKVANTPHVWKALLKSFSSGYIAAASITIHHPLKN